MVYNIPVKQKYFYEQNLQIRYTMELNQKISEPLNSKIQIGSLENIWSFLKSK